MITLDQIRLLEEKVSNAVQLIKTLKKENDSQKDEISLLMEEISTLESQKSTLTSEQSVIEKGIMDALDQLDSLTSEIESIDTSDDEVISSEPISAREETEIVQQSDVDEEIEEEELIAINSAIDAFTSIVDEEASASEIGSDESGNHSEQQEISAEDPSEEKSSEDITVEASFDSSSSASDSDIPRNLEIF